MYIELFALGWGVGVATSTTTNSGKERKNDTQIDLPPAPRQKEAALFARIPPPLA